MRKKSKEYRLCVREVQRWRGTHHYFDLMEIFASDTTGDLVNLIHRPYVVIYKHILVQCSRICNDLGNVESNSLSIDHCSLFLPIAIEFADQFGGGTFRSSSVRHSNLVPETDVDVCVRNA